MTSTVFSLGKLFVSRHLLPIQKKKNQKKIKMKTNAKEKKTNKQQKNFVSFTKSLKQIFKDEKKSFDFKPKKILRGY